MQSKICPGWVLAATALLFFLGIHGEQPEVEETK